MADTGTTRQKGTGQNFAKEAPTLGDISDKAVSASRDLADKAKDLANDSTEAIKSHAADFTAAAKEVASQAADKFTDAITSQKSAGAEYVGTLANTMRRAAGEFDRDLPIAGDYIRRAASQVEGVSAQIRSGNLNDVIRNAQGFARRQPTAFLGLAVLAGFGVVRFLKSAPLNDGAREAAEATPVNRGHGDDRKT